FLRRLVDRLAERLELGRRDDDRGGLSADRVLEDRNLAVDVSLGLRAEFGDLDAEILAGLAGAGEHDLPEARRRVLDDDRNGRLVGGVARRADDGGERRQGGCDQEFFHVLAPLLEAGAALLLLAYTKIIGPSKLICLKAFPTNRSPCAGGGRRAPRVNG